VTCSDYVFKRFSPAVWKDRSEEAATPEFPETRRSVFLKPSRLFTLGNYRLPLAVRNLQQRQNIVTHALMALCRKQKFTATENCCLVVQKLWRTTIACGKKWKRGKQFLGFLSEQLSILLLVAVVQMNADSCLKT
jgi:hypothetical protein